VELHARFEKCLSLLSKANYSRFHLKHVIKMFLLSMFAKVFRIRNRLNSFHREIGGMHLRLLQAASDHAPAGKTTDYQIRLKEGREAFERLEERRKLFFHQQPNLRDLLADLVTELSAVKVCFLGLLACLCIHAGIDVRIYEMYGFLCISVCG
jgi:hypothetical protein